MGWIRRALGPESKFNNEIPYTYEARVTVAGSASNSYVGDTICALVDALDKAGIEPADVAIYEIFTDKEEQLGIGFCLSEQGTWLSRQELCESFKARYPGHIHEHGCSFEDREHDVAGP